MTRVGFAKKKSLLYMHEYIVASYSVYMYQQLIVYAMNRNGFP
uniref:Uncharacterized protein n=1 Tax=Arundo donax TaxID=35708 RepID=A0A0A9B4P2_ARUDO